MKTETIKTEQELNEKIAELELRRLKNRARKARQRLIDDVVFLALIALLVVSWLSAPHISGDLGENLGHLASSAWQLLPLILVIDAFKRVVGCRYHHTTEDV